MPDYKVQLACKRQIEPIARKNLVVIEHLMAYGEIHLAFCRHVGADQLKIGQLNDTVIALRIEEVHQRGSSMLIGKSYGVAHINRLIKVLRFVRLDQRNIGAHQLVGIVHVAEDLRLGRFRCLLASVDVDQRSLLLPWFLSKIRSGMLTLRPRVWLPFGLFVEALFVYHAPKTGSVEPLAQASL